MRTSQDTQRPAKIGRCNNVPACGTADALRAPSSARVVVAGLHATDAHDPLEGTAGLARGYAQVQTLMREMADGRYTRLVRLGFEPAQAKQLAALHTHNFM